MWTATVASGFMFQLKAFLASDKGLAISICSIVATTVVYGVTIVSSMPQDHTASSSSTPPFYRLVSADTGHAVVETQDGRQAISVGSILPGLGAVTAIEVRDEHWTVATKSGRSLSLR